MASPINFGDVVKAIELCKSIKEKCFTRINSADLHYREFKRDILELDKRLSQLENDVHNALQQVSGKDIACHDMLKQEAADMVGGLKTTLKDCQDFLEENIKLNSRKANVLENYSWHSSSRVKDLRARIQNHTYKIFLVIKSVELQLQADIAANTHVLLDNTNEMLSILRKDAGLSVPRQLPEIPTFVVNKFTIALNRNCTVTLDDPLLLPLSEGVDILSLHFRECSVQSTSSGIPPTLEQNLSLLKAHWLVLLIETSQAFSQSRPGSLSRRMVKQIELGVEEQYKYRQITFWKAQDFEGLADSPFDIWRPRPVLKPEPATAAVGREEILANVALESRYEGHAESLIILRVSDKTIRTVLSRSYKDESTSVQTIERTEKFFDLDTDGLVPLYAIAEASERRWNVNVDYGKGGSVAYELQSRDDAFAVQRALTGYQPYAFSEAVYCAGVESPSSGVGRHESNHAGLDRYRQPVVLLVAGSLAYNLGQPSPHKPSALVKTMISL
ncbi:hypothetical protein EJ08DRAFT_79900 [Tothia fuscella]|uniref:Uncharacterized protein n=1 Tax=Tothia fuscella TaxID=1048955 RepID=A0A9P4TSV0_9PEZI|nr:hypothetical protein EJ08DRAFT_79900 [Tothia fuscella]